MTTETTKQKRFRPWVWVAILPGLFTILGVMSGIPAVAFPWLAFTAGVVFLAWRGRTTPWWAVVGWMVVVAGLNFVIVAIATDESAAFGAVLTGVGGALGVTGLIVNSIKSAAAPTPPA